MVNYALPSAFGFIILLQQIVHASVIRPTSPSQGVASGEETDAISSVIPKSLSLGDVDETKVPSQPWVTGAHPLRGGSCIATKAAPDDVTSNYAHGRFFAVHSDVTVRPTGQSDNISSSPKAKRRGTMDYESIALALRLTSEINRRLDCATSLPNRLPLHDQHQFTSTNTAAAVAATPGATLFDTPQRQRTNLTSHVKRIADTLEYEPIIPALALLFLDRASSVETLRGDDRLYGTDHHNRLLEKMCPYITPQTVHKMYLTAVILAHRTVRAELPQQMHDQRALFQDGYTQFYADLLTRGGIKITPDELGKMMEWMYHSLGMEGLNVSRSEVDRLITSWKGLFVWENGDEKERENSDRDEGISDDHDGAFDKGDASWTPPRVPWTANSFVNQGITDLEHTWDHYQQDEQQQTQQQQFEWENDHEEYILRQG